MTTATAQPLPPVWRVPVAQWVVSALVAAALIAAFFPGLEFMVANWEQVEEYSYGYFIPVISAFLIWQRSDRLREAELRGSWTGLFAVVLGMLMGVVGDLSAIRIIGQYGFVIALVGLAVGFIGWRGVRIIAMPLLVLLFMIPMPQFLLRELSQQLQLVSSQIGVELIRMFGISVFLEGNVIDLGAYKLQVVDACSGLRYLFPLMVLGFLAAYFFQGALWKRALILISTIPLTIVINSLRIGLIGVTVENWGPSMAEGLVHDFEGWFMFMVCIALLIGEMSVLARIGSKPQSLRAVFGLEYPEPVPVGTPIRYNRFPMPMVVGGLLLLAVAATTLWGPLNQQIKPQRTQYTQFPLQLPGGWAGRQDSIDKDILLTLAVDDYFIANYTRGNSPWVNFYSAYYDSQSSGASSHSPRTCIPGGGWKLDRIDEHTVDIAAANGLPASSLKVNRTVIQKGEDRQLVYYWFDQRGRNLTDELEVKWYILHDAITRSRTDGALMRLVTAVSPNEDIADADRRLADFIGEVSPLLPEYVPR